VIDFLQALILADAVLDVDDVIADLQVAEVGEEGGDFGFLALRARGDGVGFVKQVARAEDGEIGFGEQDAIGDVGFGERGGEDFAGEVAGFVGVAFAAAGAAAQAEMTLYSVKTSARRSTSPVLGTAKRTRLPSALSFCTSSSMAGTAPWKRGEGWVRNEITEVFVFLVSRG
jgi:hypothetical protein